MEPIRTSPMPSLFWANQIDDDGNDGNDSGDERANDLCMVESPISVVGKIFW